MIGDWSAGAYVGLRERGASRRGAFAAVFVTVMESAGHDGDLFADTVKRVEDAGEVYDEWLDYLLLMQLARLEERLRELGLVE